MNKKTKLAILGVIGLVLVTLSLTYAYWLITRTQTKENVITAGCLDISLTNEQNDISLTEQFPLSDEEGKELTPYTFTVTNNCNTPVDYNVNLELLGDQSAQIDASSIKVQLNNDFAMVLSDNFEEEATINNAYTSYRLSSGSLAKNGSVDYTLRLWLDEDASIKEMNKSFNSKISVTAGQGINNPLKEGTLAYDLVSGYGGAENITTFGLESTAEGIGSDSWSYEYFSNEGLNKQYYWGTSYTFNKKKGYTLSGEVILATFSECANGTKNCGKFTIYSQQEDSYSAEISRFEDFVSDTTNYKNELGYKYKYYYTKDVLEYSAKEGSANLYKQKDDYGMSYYFYGDVTNNVVQFGSTGLFAPDNVVASDLSALYEAAVFTDLTSCQEQISSTTYGSCKNVEADTLYYASSTNVSYLKNVGFTSESICLAAGAQADWTTCVKKENVSGNPLYWRIVRINGDGTIRLIYEDPTPILTGGEYSPYIATSKFNEENNNEKYIGYTYEEDGIQKDSSIKNILDTWYEGTLKNKYDKYIVDRVFCNDRNGFVFYQSSDYSEVYYKSLSRISGGNDFVTRPSLQCDNKYDNYTVSSTTGNGYLTYPVGLVTADEAALAGVAFDASASASFLATSKGYWTMSPAAKFSNSTAMEIWSIYVETDQRVSDITAEYGVRPVINLKADVGFTGDGSYTNPYVITTN